MTRFGARRRILACGFHHPRAIVSPRPDGSALQCPRPECADRGTHQLRGYINRPATSRIVDDSRSHSSAVSDLCGGQRVSVHPRYAWMRCEVRVAERAMIVPVGSWGRDSWRPSSACQPSGMRSPASCSRRARHLRWHRTVLSLRDSPTCIPAFARRCMPTYLHFTNNSRRAALQRGRRSPA